MSETPGRGLTGALTETLTGTLSGTVSRAQAAPGRVKSWWLGRLRHQVGLILATLVAAGVVGTTFVTARAFVADKEEYVLVLGSISAPNAAEGIGKHFAHLRAQLAVFDDILLSVQRSGKSSELLQSSFKKLEGVRQIDIFDESGLVASISSSPGSGNAPAAFGPRLFGEMEKGAGRVFTSESEGTRNLLWPFRLGRNLYVLQLDPAALGEYLALARPLSGILVLNGTEVVTGTAPNAEPNSAPSSAQAAQANPERELARQVARGLQSSESGDPASQKRKVVARKVSVGEDLHALAAIAPIPGIEGLSVIVHTPAEQVSKLARALLNNSLPFIALIFVLALAIGAVFTARLVKPIEELTEAAGHIGAGRWDVYLPGGSQDEIGRLVGAFSKMTRELSSREQELKRANDRIVQSERLAALGKFGAGIAHEVKNPLNSILGYAQLIQRRLATAPAIQPNSGSASVTPSGAGDETITKYLGFIMDETRRASRIISDLLGFARQKPPQLRPCPLAELLDYAYQMILPQAEAAKVEFARELVTRDGEPALVASIDRDQMFQVLLNLCTNALHALEGKSLEEKSDAAKLRIRAERQGAEIALSVIDNGSGIAPENLSRLFEPFFSTKEVGKGTGLGLALCHGIVTQHSGRIEVYSEAGKGTEFRILLPIVG